jgi:hypothetical protein
MEGGFGLMNTIENKTGVLPVTKEDVKIPQINKIQQSYIANYTSIKKFRHLRMVDFIRNLDFEFNKLVFRKTNLLNKN